MPRSTSISLFGAALLALVSLAGHAEDGAIRVSEAYARAVPPGQNNSAAYLTLSNGSGQPRALVAATSPAAESVELHTHTEEGGMMRMRRLERIEIPAGETLSLEPGGLHLMLIGLKEDLQPGGAVDLTLTFDDGAQTQVRAPVRKVEVMSMHH
jgi:periplasmic copper chaperone A